MAYRNKNKYTYQQAKRKHTYKLEPGLTGFLCTCNSKLREKDCVRESYNLLNEFADEIFGKETHERNTAVETSGTDDGKRVEDDIDSSLAREVEALKAESQKKPDLRRFQVIESGANGIVFIRTTVPDPVKLAHTIATTIATSKQQSKFLLRLLPVELTCKAYVDEICTVCDTLFDKYFCDEEKTFAIVYNHRNNDSIKREELIEKLANLVVKKNEAHKADLKQPQLAVLVEVIRSICCISVVPDYFTLKKYNLLELSTKPDEAAMEKSGDGESKSERKEEPENNEPVTNQGQ